MDPHTPTRAEVDRFVTEEIESVPHLEALLDCMMRNAELRGDLLRGLMLNPFPQANLLALR